MKINKALQTSTIIAAASFAAASQASPLYVPYDSGETGWQHYSFTFENDYTGIFGFGVADFDDSWADSTLLVDNISLGPTGNADFELGSFTGYDTYGSGTSIVTSDMSVAGTTYLPTSGNYMARLNSVNGFSGDLLANWHVAAEGAYDGSTMEYTFTASAGDSIEFDWAYYTSDGLPDFGFIYQYQLDGGVETFERYEILAQSGPSPVPVPAAAWLFGSGLLGLIGVARHKKVA